MKIPQIKFERITPEFCYVLGSVLTDGSINVKERYIDLGVTDKDFAQEFKKMAELWTGFRMGSYSYKYDKNKREFRIVVCSKIITDYVYDFDYTKIFNVGRRSKSYFLRAVYDAEGGVSLNTKEIEVCSTNTDFLYFIKKLLESLGIESSKLYKSASTGQTTYLGRKKIVLRKDCYDVTICKRKNLELFNKLIGFTIKRKQDKLNKLLQNGKQ